MSLLSQHDKDFFRDNGYLFVRDVVKKDNIAEALDAMWSNMEEDRNDPSTWIDKGYRTVPMGDELGVKLIADSNIYPMAEEMVGADKLSRGHRANTAYLVFPRSDKTWHKPGGHLDGYSKGELDRGTVGRFCIAVTLLLGDVESQGGAFSVFPESHRIFGEYFRTHPIDATRGGGVSFQLPDPVEFTGQAGDICFWHYWTYHNASTNVRDTIRAAAICRMSRVGGEDQYLKFANPNGDPFIGWEGMAS
ncbi:MAG: phytanoyl-CoA dioxygenase family protein [Candidatus Poribacteria bacterium]|nr:phytanoyl-CoA dioxygenase family protein [Candidatus Poribacteria bacterium]